MPDPHGAADPTIDVVIVAYAAETFIAECLESLFAAGWPRLRVVVVDNASPDGTAQAVRDWARGAGVFAPPADWPLPPAPPALKPARFVEHAPTVTAPAPDGLEDGDGAGSALALLSPGVNLGFAGGVNAGLRAFAATGHAPLTWILNPDSVVAPGAPAAFARRAAAAGGRFGVISGRVTFYDRPGRIQADAGRYRPWMGYGASVNLGREADGCPDPDMRRVDYVPGMSMLVSRPFLARAGFMEEAWFLYYEEIDWVFRRGDLPILFARDARVLHRAGASIGTGSGGKAASPLSVYFMHRNLPRFAWRWTPMRAPVAMLVACGIVLRDHLVRRRAWPQLVAGLRGLAQLGPPRAVRARLGPAVWQRLSGRSA